VMHRRRREPTIRVREGATAPGRDSMRWLMTWSAPCYTHQLLD
jgi:hypothetical protein